MRNIAKYLIGITLLFLVLAGCSFLLIEKHYDNENGMRNVVMNRIVKDAEDVLRAGGCFTADLNAYRGEFPKNAVPKQADLIRTDGSFKENTMVRDTYSNEFFYSVPDGDGGIVFLRFRYASDDRRFTEGIVWAVLFLSYLSILAVLIAGYRLMVAPFEKLSDYPEKLAKGRLEEGIPQSKSRLFVKYIWGMNMLKDEMGHKERTLRAMEKEKQTLVVSIAHGIKTPLSNIKLYAEAIERGIYHKDKTPDPKDAETAEKIGKNVEKVEVLLKEIIDSSSGAETDYRPVTDSFYLEEVAKSIQKEYSGRMELLHIPFEVRCDNNPLLCSDQDGIVRVISQLLDNAVKYGSGQSIVLKMGRQDEDVIISVKNKGGVLSEEECAYVFKSFWRGSNAKNKEGQGIGLYVAKKIAERLGGDLFMKSWPEEEMMEVTMLLPMEAVDVKI